MDNTKLKTVYNTEQYWYPSLRQHVILSQQVTRYGLIDPSMDKIETPQTSSFDWVKVREFFLAPEIDCPDAICTTETASLDVDDRASDFSWSLTPTNLFSGAKTGTGNIASITAAAGVSGEGKITYSFEMPSGETFTAEKTFWVGAPVISDISGPTYTPNDEWATYQAELESESSDPTDYNWILNPLNGNSVYDYGISCDIAFYNSGSYQLVVQAKNTCSEPYYGRIMLPE